MTLIDEGETFRRIQHQGHRKGEAPEVKDVASILINALEQRTPKIDPLNPAKWVMSLDALKAHNEKSATDELNAVKQSELESRQRFDAYASSENFLMSTLLFADWYPLEK